MPHYQNQLVRRTQCGYWDAQIASFIISVVVALLNGLIKSKS